MTCSHVIDAALGRSKDKWGKTPHGDIVVDFPLLPPDYPEDKPRFLLHVVDWESRLKEDIVRLIFDKSNSPPDGASNVRLAFPSEKHITGLKVEAFGCPALKTDGIWAEGRLSRVQAKGWIEIKGYGESNYFIKPGFSGGPVWSESLQGVVGMVVASDLDPRFQEAFMIPSEKFANMIPAIDSTRGGIVWRLKWFRSDILRQFLNDLAEREMEGLTPSECNDVRTCLFRIINAAGDATDGAFWKSKIYPELVSLYNLYFQWNDHDRTPNAISMRRITLGEMLEHRIVLSDTIKKAQGVLATQIDENLLMEIYKATKSISDKYPHIFKNLASAVSDFV